MSLSEQDREELREQFYDCGWLREHVLTDDIAPAVEAIVARHVNAALAEAAERIEACMGRDADFDDGCEEAARIVRDLRT